MLKRPLMLFAVCVLAAAPLRGQACTPPRFVPGARDVNIFSEDREVDLGDAVAEHIQRDFRVIDNDEIAGYLRRIGERITRHLPPTRLQFQFSLVDLPEANAFVLPGGRIYVSRKLIAFAASEDELAGVIAHEIGHLVARHATLRLSRQMKEVLGVTTVTDRKDVFEKYNQLVENTGRKPGAFDRRANHEDKDQIAADRIGLFAATAAGYDPTAQSRLWDRLNKLEARPGGFFSGLFGASNPEAQRLRELIRGMEALPPSCIDVRKATSLDEYRGWQAAVVTYTGASRRESVHGVVSKVTLEAPLRAEVTHLRFSPDGRYVISQDDSGINILSHEPFAFLFRIPAPVASRARFTPDSRSVVFFNGDLRVEVWSVAEGKLAEAHELVLRTACAQAALSPDGRTIACLNWDFALRLLDVASGNPIFERKAFYAPTPLSLLIGSIAAGGAGNPALEMEDADLVGMGFSTDSHYFATGTVVPEAAALVFDLEQRAPLPLKEPVRRMLAGQFVFTGPDRLIAISEEDPKRSAVVRLPQGDVVERVAMFRGNLTPATRGPYMLVRPANQYAVGVLDVAKGEVFRGNDNTAIDVYDRVLVAERLTGELGLYGLEKNDLLATVQLPGGELANLKTASVSPDFKWLAVADSARGSAWDLTTGKSAFLTRAFRDSHIAPDGTLVAVFPRYQDTERRLARVDLTNPNTSAGEPVDEGILFGDSLFRIRRGRITPGSVGDITLEMLDARTSRPHWSKTFVAEAMPQVWTQGHAESIVLGWPAASRGAREAAGADSAVSRRLKQMKDKEGDYLLQVVDAHTGASRGHLLIETGKGSFEIADAFAVDDWVVLSDSENRLLVFTLSAGEKRGQVFGARAIIGRPTGMLAVQNDDSRLTLYDLASLQKRDEFAFAHPIAFAEFSPDGKRLFVLTADQCGWVLDVPAPK